MGEGQADGGGQQGTAGPEGIFFFPILIFSRSRGWFINVSWSTICSSSDRRRSPASVLILPIMQHWSICRLQAENQNRSYAVRSSASFSVIEMPYKNLPSELASNSTAVVLSVVWVAEPPRPVPGWVVALAVLAGLLLLALLIFIMYKVRWRWWRASLHHLLLLHLASLCLLSWASSSECAPPRRTVQRRSSCSQRKMETLMLRAPPLVPTGTEGLLPEESRVRIHPHVALFLLTGWPLGIVGWRVWIWFPFWGDSGWWCHFCSASGHRLMFLPILFLYLEGLRANVEF